MHPTSKKTCTLVQVTPRNGRMSFVFSSGSLRVNPMRTCRLTNSTLEVKSLFDIYSEEILGKPVDVSSADPESLAYMLKEHAKGKKFELEVAPSACGKYTDILSIKAL